MAGFTYANIKGLVSAKGFPTSSGNQWTPQDIQSYIQYCQFYSPQIPVEQMLYAPAFQAQFTNVLDLLDDGVIDGSFPPVTPAITTTFPSNTYDLATTATLSVQFVGTGGGITWTATGLPSGVTLSKSGLLSGSTAVVADSAIVVTATNSSGTATYSFTLSVGLAPAITSTSPLPSGTNGTAYTTTLTGTNGTSWAVTGGALPAGLTLASGTGVISGTPTASGTFTPLITFYGTYGSTSQTFSLTIA